MRSFGRVLTYSFGLIALYTAVTRADAVSGVLGYTTAITRRLSDPTVGLIPKRSAGSSSTSSTGTLSNGSAYTPGSGTNQASGLASDINKRHGETGSSVLVAPGQVVMGGTK